MNKRGAGDTMTDEEKMVQTSYLIIFKVKKVQTNKVEWVDKSTLSFTGL